MANKLTNCKVCGAEMAASAKVCPNCGAKNKKPIYKKWWFWLLIVIIIGAIIGGSGDSSKPAGSNDSADDSTQEEISYTHYDVTDLFDALHDNAAKAQETFNGQYVEIEGYLGTIDSDGKYIGVGANPDDLDYLFSEVKCNIQNDEQRQQVMEMSKEDAITVCGKITDVGEIMGYTLKIDSIK